MRKLAIVGVGLGLVCIALAVLHFQQKAAFEEQLAALVARLQADAMTGPAAAGPGPAKPPEPLATFLSGVIAADRPSARLVRIEKRGEIKMTPDGDWMPMRADEYLAVRTPGFVWIARVQLAPLVTLVVVDSYIAGKSRLEARLLGSIQVIAEEPTDDASSQLTRYLAEMIWAPEAFLANPKLEYAVAGDQAVEVKIGHARARYVFDDDGMVDRILIPDRPRETADDMVPTTWEGQYEDYGDLGPDAMIRLPVSANETWLQSDGPFMYWRGRVTDWQAFR